MLAATKVKILLAVLGFLGGVVSAAATIATGTLSNLGKLRTLLEKPPIVGEFVNRSLAASTTSNQADRREDCVSSQGRRFEPTTAKIILLRQSGPRCEMAITRVSHEEVCFKVWAMPEAREIPVTCVGYPQVRYAAP